MFSADLARFGRTFITAAALLVVPAAAHAAIVVSSSGPSAGAYPVGKKLDDAGSVTLRAGDSVTVLDGKGTRVLRGAGTFPVAAGGAASKASTFAVLTMQRSAQRVRTGAVRAGSDGTPPASPNLWFVDVSKGGTRCIVSGQPLRFWRLEKAAAVTYSARLGGGAPVQLAFPAGEMVAPWDTAKWPIADGAKVSVGPGGKPPVEIVFAVLPAQPADAEAMAAELIARGCTAQLDLLSATLARP